MSNTARPGRWILVAVIAITALSEIMVAGMSLYAGQFRIGQVVRVLLTAWLLWRVWDGAGWARWLMVVLFFAAAGFAAVLGVGGSVAADQRGIRELAYGMLVLFVVLGLGLASPWVGAYQASRCGSPNAEQSAETDRPRE